MSAYMHLQILDLDGSLCAQDSLRDAAPWASVRTVPLRDLAARLRLWSRDRTMQAARTRLAGTNGLGEPTVTLIGSGDYHHLAVLLMERVHEPITVVHFDNHPDWVRFAPRWHCGSWVNQALRLPQVNKVVTIGPCSQDLERPELKGGNLAALACGRIALFPWQHAPSRVWRSMPDGAGHRYENGHLVWRNLAEGSLDASVDVIMSQVATDAVWLTIDKDVLSEDEAVTNWDQGRMPLQAVLRVIRAVGARKRVLGADICGEYSHPEFSNALKRWEARHDQPRRDPVDAAMLARNERVNRELLSTIEQVGGSC